MARYSKTASTIDSLGQFALLGGVAYFLYYFLKLKQVGSSASDVWSHPLDSIYNAVTGKPTSDQITPAEQYIYKGPNAPPQNPAMQQFLAAGRNVNDEVPGTGQIAADLVKVGYSWNDVNSMFDE